MDGIGDESQEGLGYDMPPHIFPNYGVSGGSPFNSQSGLGGQDDERIDGDPKRRRIARVSPRTPAIATFDYFQ
jgi:hypothetical protein